MKEKTKTGTLLLVAALALSGCFRLGPDYSRPNTPFTVPKDYQHADSALGSYVENDRWWEGFGDPALNDLVEEALLNNLDIQKAAAVILEIESLFVQARADRYPSVNLQAQAQRQRQPGTTTFPGLAQGRITETYNLALPASFEIDLWGRLARSEEAVRAELLRAEETQRTVAQGVVAETVSLYFQIEALERRIQITQESIRSFKKSVALVDSRYRRGLATLLDLRQARRILTQAEAILPGLRQELALIQQDLALVLGRYPETQPPRPQPVDYYQPVGPVPPGLPSELLLRRPDIRAAEANLQALNARIGVAKASRFPRITLTGTYGYSSEALDRLFKPESELWSLAAGLIQPLFNAGKLEAGQRAAEARYQQGVVEYAKTVLGAFTEVERALVTRKEQMERRERLLAFLEEARATQEVAEKRYSRGLVDYLAVLDSQQTRFTAEQNMVLADLAIFTNRVALHRALGGGWADPPPRLSLQNPARQE